MGLNTEPLILWLVASIFTSLSLHFSVLNMSLFTLNFFFKKIPSNRAGKGQIGGSNQCQMDVGNLLHTLLHKCFCRTHTVTTVFLVARHTSVGPPLISFSVLKTILKSAAQQPESANCPSDGGPCQLWSKHQKTGTLSFYSRYLFSHPRVYTFSFKTHSELR